MTINTVPGSYDSAIVKLAATTFTSATTVNVDGIFNGNYANYKVLINITDSSTDQNLQMRYLASGTANTASSYTTTVKGFSASATFVESFVGATTSFYIGSLETITSNGGYNSYELTIFNPYPALRTKHINIGGGVSQAGAVHTQNGFGIQDQATSFTGLQLLLSGAGNIGGTIRVYGIED